MLVIAKCLGISRLKVIDVWWMIPQNRLNVLHDLQRKWLQITDSQIRDEEIPVILLYNTPLAMSNNTRCSGRGCWHLVGGRGRLLSILQCTGPSLSNRQPISVETEEPGSDNGTWCWNGNGRDWEVWSGMDESGRQHQNPCSISMSHVQETYITHAVSSVVAQEGGLCIKGFQWWNKCKPDQDHRASLDD